MMLNDSNAISCRQRDRQTERDRDRERGGHLLCSAIPSCPADAVSSDVSPVDVVSLTVKVQTYDTCQAAEWKYDIGHVGSVQ